MNSDQVPENSPRLLGYGLLGLLVIILMVLIPLHMAYVSSPQMKKGDFDAKANVEARINGAWAAISEDSKGGYVQIRP